MTSDSNILAEITASDGSCNNNTNNRIKEILSSVQFKVKYISVAPNMDLVLIVSESEEVLAYRFIQNWVKVWSCSRTLSANSVNTNKNSIIGVAWEPSGKYCAVGHADGTLAYCDVESGAVFMRIFLDLKKYDEKGLASLKFSLPPSGCEPEAKSDDYYDSLLPPGEIVPKYPCSGLPDDEQVVYQAICRHLLDSPENCRNISLLACFGKSLNIFLLSGGFVLLAVIQLGSELSPLPLLNCQQFDCDSLSGDLMAVCEYKMRNIKSFCVYRLASPLMKANKRHVTFLARSLTDFIGCQEMARNVIEHLAQGLESVLFEFGTKIDTLAAGNKTANAGLVSADFIQLLLLGRCSSETENFFVLSMGERSLQRLSNSLQKNFGGLLKQTISTLAAIADRMVLVSSRLSSLVKYEKKLGQLDVDPSLAAAVYRAALQFRLKIAQLHSVAQQDIGQLTSFVKFLQYEMSFLTAKQQRDGSMVSQARMDIPKDLTPLSADDIKNVINFINRNFVEDYETGKCTIKFNRISQFFQSQSSASSKADESICLSDIDTVQNPWISFMLDIETTPLMPGNDGPAAEIAADFEAILPRNDLEETLVQSLTSFSNCLKNFVSATNASLTASYDVDWCAKLPIHNLGDCVVRADADDESSILGAFLDRESGQLLALRIDHEKRQARVDKVGFSGGDVEARLKPTRVLPVKLHGESNQAGLGIYVVLENSKNCENFGRLFLLSDEVLSTTEEAPSKGLNAIPAAVLQPPTISHCLPINDAKCVSFGRLHASDLAFIASTGRSLIILQPGFQLLRAFPGLSQIFN